MAEGDCFSERDIQIGQAFAKRRELYALSDQMRRAVVSVPSNIAEGYGRNSKKDYGRFLSISLGSVYELQTQLIVCCELEFLRPDDVRSAMDLITEISKMLNALIRKWLVDRV